MPHITSIGWRLLDIAGETLSAPTSVIPVAPTGMPFRERLLVATISCIAVSPFLCSDGRARPRAANPRHPNDCAFALTYRDYKALLAEIRPVIRKYASARHNQFTNPRAHAPVNTHLIHKTQSSFGLINRKILNEFILIVSVILFIVKLPTHKRESFNKIWKIVQKQTMKF